MSASPNKLRLTLGLGFLAFIIAGSLLLLAWLRQREREESNRLFQALAQADAEFVRRMNLPRSEKLAKDLKELLGVSIVFLDRSDMPPAAEYLIQSEIKRGKVEDLNDRQQSVVVELDGRHYMRFFRLPPASSLSLRDPATLNAFITFWLISALVGWLLVRERLKRAQSERLAMLGRVATSLAHDIKNPLASIQLHAQLMTPQNEEDAQAVRLIENESEVIAGLVNQWLHLANPLPPKLVKVDLTECIRGVAANMEAQARHAGVEVDIELPSPVWIMGDSQRLAQAVRNLMINAIQAMPRGGSLKISGQPANAFFELHFTDSGTGFSEQALAQGTELFFTEKEGGMGVGLNIVSSVITAHGGTMKLQNDPKGGAVIIVLLPFFTA
ncbi:MAG: HAMP domain-containing histidine kinase [Prosthecobacter sp.]|uniref:sensor histidine kinase n=1 Tax=Prosthecobacter sp. TaxID=1965333 RepID=UPI0025F5A7B6|nr:HAMP domain-containing sensor histidine kinase [Prosthecobacter sp.]MCF7784724.1 HAMP domain-containing histidine kinase [Prosthecobacter sp.]